VIRRRILLGVALAALFGVGWLAGRVRATGSLYANVDVFLEVLHAVQTSYVDPVESRPLVEGGVRGMLRGLDPHARYLDGPQLDALRGESDDDSAGIGARIDAHEGFPVVVTSPEGTPAWEAGLEPGDLLAKLDGHVLQSLSVPEVETRLRGAPGTKLTLTVLREGADAERDVVVERRRPDPRGVSYAFVADPGVGYVRLQRFSATAGAELAGALDTLRLRGARALVLDLRGNPGGPVEQAVAVAQQLVPEGTLVASTKGRVPASDRIWRAGRSRHELAWPVAVLVDKGSASAAEIVAGALQDLDRALVVGQASFGEGAVQEVFPLRNHQGGIQLTTSRYTTPSGRSLHRAVAMEPDDDTGDDADSSAATPAPPAFRTASGRVVHGGVGIEPDVRIDADSLPPLAREVISRRLAYRFATTWVPAHGAALDAAAWNAFRASVAGAGIKDVGRLDGLRSALEPDLEHELVRRASGAAAAARVALGHDRAYRRAVEVLRAARAPRDVFALAGRDGGASPAAERRSPARRPPVLTPDLPNAPRR
jgi:carboxyl-terminal processing protease